MRHLLHLALLALAALPLAVFADDVRPGLVEIDELAKDRYVVRWSLPPGVGSSGNARLDFPPTCLELSATQKSRHFDCPGGLSGRQLAIEFVGLTRPIHTVLRLRLLSGEEHTKVLSPRARIWQVPPKETLGRVLRDYMGYGVIHIFKGVDHLLFVLCLIWIATGWRRILLTITAFTIAHSVTLILSALNLVRLGIAPVEATIALSVAFLASEVIRGNRNSLTWRYPATVAAAFGLVHGLGFASVLADIGLPQTQLLSALVSFNLGVELGQVLFALPVALLVWQMRVKGWRTDLARRLVGYGVGSLAAFWVVTRMLAFVP